MEPIQSGRAVVRLPRSRYTANHTFRVTLQCADGATALLVHLVPSDAELRAWGGSPARADTKLASAAAAPKL
jgi:hypothetical protein